MSIVFKIVKRLIIVLVSLVVAGVISLLLWRVISSKNPKDMEILTPTDDLLAAYSQSGEELYMFNQKQRSITSAENNYGYFSITDYVIIPDANEIQALFRYNTSTLKRTAEDYGLEAIPSRDSEVYEVSLLFAIDLTPENADDNLGNDPESVRFVRCKGTVVSSGRKNMYNYRRLAFDLDDAELNVKQLMDDGLLLAIYADVCYLGNVDYEKPYGTLCLYDYLSPNVVVELDKKDIKALGK